MNPNELEFIDYPPVKITVALYKNPQITAEELCDLIGVDKGDYNHINTMNSYIKKHSFKK